MKGTSQIKHSIKATRDISQITSAMRLISTSKMQKAIKRYRANSIYFNKVRQAMKDILLHSPNGIQHPFLKPQKKGVKAYVVLAADKGMCGGYNHNILSFAQKQMESEGDKLVITVGQETRVFFEKKNIPIDIEYLHIAQDPSLYNARNLASDLTEMYMRGDISEVNIVFTRFYSSIRQTPAMFKLLPVSLDDFKDVEEEPVQKQELDYYPSLESVLKVLITQYIVGIIYGALVQAFASEQSQRMMAMENATKNANEMVDKYTVQLNRARQASITSDITEIVGAMDAL
jgi:F-type H+-transporting ATPase subunit gamma